MSQDRSYRSLTVALYVNAVVLLAIFVAIWDRSGGVSLLHSAQGQTQAPIAGGAGVFVVPAQFSATTFGCYLMDVDTQTLMAYNYVPPADPLNVNSKVIKFVGARTFRYDRRLGNYNTVPPPMEIKQYVDTEQQAGNRVLDRPTERPPIEAPPKQE